MHHHVLFDIEEQRTRLQDRSPTMVKVQSNHMLSGLPLTDLINRRELSSVELIARGLSQVVERHAKSSRPSRTEHEKILGSWTSMQVRSMAAGVGVDVHCGGDLKVLCIYERCFTHTQFDVPHLTRSTRVRFGDARRRQRLIINMVSVS